MFIKDVPKIDKNSGKKYHYYRLCESYRTEDTVKHRTILLLGPLSELSSDKERKALAQRIRQLLAGQQQTLFDVHNATIEELAQKFYYQIVNQRLVDDAPVVVQQEKFEPVDLNSVGVENVREIGSEWMCYQALIQLGLVDCLKRLGFSELDISLSLMHIISRAVHPASEYATVNWLQENSGLCELLEINPASITHHKLYRISNLLYKHHASIEHFLSKKTNELFDLDDKIILYDLTNTYFEGRKDGSSLAMFGNSKEKRKDAKLVTLALVVNVEGFVKHSKIYRGNISEPKTLETMIDELSVRTSFSGRKPIVVIDAGIATEDNLLMLRQKGYHYVCVSRKALKEYVAVKQDSPPVLMKDKRDNPIELLCVKEEDTQDNFLYVHSQRKEIKEVSMHERFTSHYVLGLEQIKKGIDNKGGTKKIEKVWERIGRLKEKYPNAHKFYAIDLRSKNGLATQITWEKITPARRKSEGVYFLRTSIENITETVFWDIYNTIREIESCFRTLKNDLDIRPVFHQKDDNTMAHLHLAVLSYQMVNTIRFQLKPKGIRHNWSELVRVMNTQKVATITMHSQKRGNLYIRKCSKPEAKAMVIYQALKYKPYPWLRKSVLPDKPPEKNEPPENKGK